MNIKNIKLFKSEPIVIETEENEKIIIHKVPAMATILLFENNEFLDELGELVSLHSGGLDGINLVKRVFLFVEKYREIINQIIEPTIKKDLSWIEENMNEMQIFSLINAILIKAVGDTQQFAKKNNSLNSRENPGQ